MVISTCFCGDIIKIYVRIHPFYGDILIANSHINNDYALQPLYNTVHYNTVLDITRFKDGSQKCIDYIEK